MREREMINLRLLIHLCLYILVHILIYLFYFHVYACLPMCVYVAHVYLVPSGQKKALDPLEMELQMVMNHYMDTQELPSPLQEQLVLLAAEL